MKKKSNLLNAVIIWFKDGSDKTYEFCHVEIKQQFVVVIGDQFNDDNEYDELYIQSDDIDKIKVIHRRGLSGKIINSAKED